MMLLTLVPIALQQATAPTIPNPTRPDCDVPTLTDQDTASCLGKRYIELDEALTDFASYAFQTAARIDAENADRGVFEGRTGILLRAQRSWEAYAKAQCELERVQEEGEAKRMMRFYSCMIAMTQARADELRSLFPNRP